MKAEEFKLEYVKKIMELYSECVGSSMINDLSAKNILQDIQKWKVDDGYRVGSRWTGHSKLTFRKKYPHKDIIPEFNPNFDPQNRDSEYHKEAIEAAELFEKKSLEYLTKFE